MDNWVTALSKNEFVRASDCSFAKLLVVMMAVSSTVAPTTTYQVKSEL